MDYYSKMLRIIHKAPKPNSPKKHAMQKTGSHKVNKTEPTTT